MISATLRMFKNLMTGKEEKRKQFFCYERKAGAFLAIHMDFRKPSSPSWNL
jgi:hypothetical protein